MKIVIYKDDGTIHQELEDTEMFIILADLPRGKDGNGAFVLNGSSKFLAKAVNIITKIAFEKLEPGVLLRELLKMMEHDSVILNREDNYLDPKPDKEVN